MTGTEIFLGDLVECKAVSKERNNCSVLADYDVDSIVKMEKCVIVMLTVATNLMMNEFEGRCLEVVYHSSNLRTVRLWMEVMLESIDVVHEAPVCKTFVEDWQVYSNLES